MAPCGGQVVVPIQLSDGSDVSALQFVVDYDSNLLTATSVSDGSLLNGHSVTSNTSTPGQVSVAIVSLSLASMNPSPGSVVSISFNATSMQPGGTSAVTLGGIVAADTTGSAVSVSGVNGSVSIDCIPPPLEITSSSLPGGQVGAFYTFTISATGGSTPYSWSVTGGALPSGLTLAANGSLSGTPSQEGTSNFTVRVTDNSGGFVERSFELTLSPNPDGDGVPDEVEDQAPNGGDGNGDGIPDSDQVNVSSLPNPEDGSFLTLETPPGTSLVNVETMGNPALDTAPQENSFPIGFFEFVVQGVGVGQSTTVAIFLEEKTRLTTYWKYGFTPNDLTDHWYEFLFDGQTGAEILEDRILLHFVDGQRGDDDVVANGEISDPGAPAFASGVSLIFPQFANGELVAGEPNRTRIILRNNSSQVSTGRLLFQGASGNLTTVPVSGNMVDHLDYSLEPWGSMDIETDGTGEFQTGVIVVVDDPGSSGVVGTEIFEILGNFVSVNNALPGKSHQIFVSVDQEENTGVAMYNPSPDATARLSLILLDSLGVEIARQEDLELLPGQQLVGFVDGVELFQNYFDANPEDFQGTLNVSVSTGPDIALIGLLQKRATGALIVVAASSTSFGPQE